MGHSLMRPVKFSMNISYMLIFGNIFMAILDAFTLNLLESRADFWVTTNSQKFLLFLINLINGNFVYLKMVNLNWQTEQLLQLVEISFCLMWRHQKYECKNCTKIFLQNSKFCMNLAYFFCAELMQDASTILVEKQSILLPVLEFIIIFNLYIRNTHTPILNNLHHNLNLLTY